MKPFIHNFIFPTAENGQKALLLRNIVLIPLVGLTVGINLLWLMPRLPGPKVKGSLTNMTPSEITALTNLERTKANVGLLKPNDLLQEAAYKKGQSMIEAGVFEHYYEAEGELVNPWQFILESGYEYFHAGENLGKDFTDASILVQAWIDSPTHRDNLLNPDYTEIGVAVLEGPYLDKQQTTLVVQLFATPVDSVAADGFASPTNPGDINIAPLLQHEQSWAQQLVKEYPLILFTGTLMVTVLIGLTLLIDVETAKKKAKMNEISIDLWRH